ncbi:unnamed protein product [Bubo scandiacus]
MDKVVERSDQLHVQADIVSIEEWFVLLGILQGLNIFATEGRLLDTLREPILLWKLDEKISPEDLDDVIPYVINITWLKSPCADDVVVIALIHSSAAHGVCVGVSYTEFVYEETKWFSMTKNVYQTGW